MNAGKHGKLFNKEDFPLNLLGENLNWQDIFSGNFSSSVGANLFYPKGHYIYRTS